MKKRWDIIDDHDPFRDTIPVTIPVIDKRFVSQELEQFPQHCSQLGSGNIFYPAGTQVATPFFEDVRYFSKRFPVIPRGRPPAIL